MLSLAIYNSRRCCILNGESNSTRSKQSDRSKSLKKIVVSLYRIASVEINDIRLNNSGRFRQVIYLYIINKTVIFLLKTIQRNITKELAGNVGLFMKNAMNKML